MGQDKDKVDLNRKSDLDDNFMQEFADFQANSFIHCTAQTCDFAENCEHKTFTKLRDDQYEDLKDIREDGTCNNYFEDIRIKYPIKKK